MRFFFAFLTTVEFHRRFHFIARCLFYRVIKTYVKTNVASLKRRWRLREDGLGLISSITTEGRKEEREEKNNTKKKQEIIQIEFDYKLVDMRSMGKENWPRRRRRRSSTRSWFVNFLIFFSPFPDIIESVNGPMLLRCKTICSRTSTFNAPRLVWTMSAATRRCSLSTNMNIFKWNFEHLEWGELVFSLIWLDSTGSAVRKNWNHEIPGVYVGLWALYSSTFTSEYIRRS